MPVFAPPTVMFVRGRGTELWDTDGKRYLDFLCGLAVTSLGHANPAVAEAIARQAHQLLHVSNFFANPVAIQAAIEVDALLAETTGLDGQVFFTNSGAEAKECASSWPASTADVAATSLSARSAASTAARWRRWPQPASRPSTSRSSRCPRASTTSRGVTSTPSSRH